LVGIAPDWIRGMATGTPDFTGVPQPVQCTAEAIRITTMNMGRRYWIEGAMGGWLKIIGTFDAILRLPRSRLCEAVKEPFATEVNLAIDHRRRGAERIVEPVDRKDGVFPIVLQDHRDPVSCRHIDPVCRTHR